MVVLDLTLVLLSIGFSVMTSVDSILMRVNEVSRSWHVERK